MRQGVSCGGGRARRHLVEREGAPARRAARPRAGCHPHGPAGRGRSRPQLEAVFELVRRRWGRLDSLVHSIAFAPKEDLQGGLLDCSAAGFAKAMDISCHSFIRMAKLAVPLMKDGGTM